MLLTSTQSWEMISKYALFTALAAIVASASAHAAVTISTAATQNMNCSGGTCEPTATKAVLNATDLETYLSQSGNVRVMTTGNGVEANNIVVRAAFSTPDSTSLTLDAHKAIAINAAVSIGSGSAELELQSDTLDATDTLSFGRKGHITFGSLSDIFGINGGIFTLVGSVQGLASAVAANPSGAFALANSYNAGQDGAYSYSPVTEIKGTFEGLGNSFSNLTIADSTDLNVGFFSVTDSNSRISDISFANANVVSTRTKGAFIGVLAGLNTGTITDAHAKGTVTIGNKSRHNGYAGGLVGENNGLLSRSDASANVTVDIAFGSAGGLVGDNNGTISECYAVGSVSTLGYQSVAGGLIGNNNNKVSDSYATGASDAPVGSGGLIGVNDGLEIDTSYSTGQVQGGGYEGGLIGEDVSRSGKIDDAYWDTDTSGITNLSQGAGNIANDPGITGLTTEQLQSGPPAGFDPKIWAEDPNINNGLPYLIANPPPT